MSFDRIIAFIHQTQPGVVVSELDTGIDNWQVIIDGDEEAFSVVRIEEGRFVVNVGGQIGTVNDLATAAMCVARYWRSVKAIALTDDEIDSEIAALEDRKDRLRLGGGSNTDYVGRATEIDREIAQLQAKRSGVEQKAAA